MRALRKIDSWRVAFFRQVGSTLQIEAIYRMRRLGAFERKMDIRHGRNGSVYG